MKNEENDEENDEEKNKVEIILCRLTIILRCIILNKCA